MITNLPLHEYIAMRNQLVELQAKLSDKFATNGCIIDDLANMVHTLLEKSPEASLGIVDELQPTYGYKIKKGTVTYEINRSHPEVMEINIK